MINARRPSTYRQYYCYIADWHKYSSVHNIDPIMPSIPEAVNFLETIRSERKLGYNAMNTARSALASILQLPHGASFGQDPLVRTYMKGVYQLTPPVPRYCGTWDPHTVLSLLRTWSPAHKTDLQQLTFKVVALVLLVSGQRIQTLNLLDLKNMRIGTSSIRFTIPGLLKQTRPGYKNPEITLKAYAPDRRLCIFTYLNEYLERTKALRTDDTALFVTLHKPHRKASKDTLGRWVKTVMTKAGIDISVFAPHSFRGASTSAAKRGGATTKEIMDNAGWTGDSVFRKYYDRPVHVNNKFDLAVLQ